VRRALVFLPSLAIGVAGAVWLLVRGGRYSPHLGLGWQLLLGAATGLALLALAWLLERRLPSFRYASRLMEDALQTLDLPLWAGPLLAAATAGGEELFFRGALLPVVGVLGQALLFGVFHPVPPRGWAYPAFVALAGLVFGWLAVTSGSLAPSMVAHFVINVQGFWQGGRGAGPSRTAAPSAGPAGGEGAAPDGRAAPGSDLPPDGQDPGRLEGPASAER